MKDFNDDRSLNDNKSYPWTHDIFWWLHNDVRFHVIDNFIPQNTSFENIH